MIMELAKVGAGIRLQEIQSEMATLQKFIGEEHPVKKGKRRKKRTKAQRLAMSKAMKKFHANK